MSVIEINSLDDPRVAVFGRLTEAQLRNRLHPEQGIFIAESPKVITTALDAGYEPVSLLCERRHIDGDAASIISRIGDLPVYTGDRALLTALTGYTLTRGVLCAMRRRPTPDVATLCKDASRVAGQCGCRWEAYFSCPGAGVGLICGISERQASRLPQWL